MPFYIPLTGILRTYKIIVSLYRLNEKFTISLHSIYGELIIILYYKDMKDMQCLPAVPRIAIKEDNE